jgi:hypothetical protein
MRLNCDSVSGATSTAIELTSVLALEISMRNAMNRPIQRVPSRQKCKQNNAKGNLNLLLKFARKIGNHGTNITGFACNSALGVEYRFRQV